MRKREGESKKEILKREIKRKILQKELKLKPVDKKGHRIILFK